MRRNLYTFTGHGEPVETHRPGRVHTDCISIPRKVSYLRETEGSRYGSRVNVKCPKKYFVKSVGLIRLLIKSLKRTRELFTITSFSHKLILYKGFKVTLWSWKRKGGGPCRPYQQDSIPDIVVGSVLDLVTTGNPFRDRLPKRILRLSVVENSSEFPTTVHPTSFKSRTVVTAFVLKRLRGGGGGGLIDSETEAETGATDPFMSTVLPSTFRRCVSRRVTGPGSFTAVRSR